MSETRETLMPPRTTTRKGICRKSQNLLYLKAL
jgi:hypothetical protein